MALKRVPLDNNPQRQRGAQPQEPTSSPQESASFPTKAGFAAGRGLDPFLSMIGRGLTSTTPTGALQPVFEELAQHIPREKLPSFLEQLLPPQRQESPPLSQLVAQQAGYTPQQLQGEGGLERLGLGGIERFARIAPYAAAPHLLAREGAKSLAAPLARTGLGALAGSATEEVTESPLAGDIAQMGAEFLPSALRGRPTKVFEPKIESKQRAAFEAGKASRLAQAAEEYTPQIQEQKSLERSAARQLAKTQDEFGATRLKQIKNLQGDLKSYDDTIAKLDKARNPLYKKADALEKGAIGDAKPIVNTITDVADNLKYGVPLKDREKINELMGPLYEKAKDGILSLDEAKKFQKNLNSLLYPPSKPSLAYVPPSRIFKREVKNLVNSLNEFIGKAGSPEHNRLWSEAEEMTQQRAEMLRNKPQFTDKIKQEISNLKMEKFPKALEDELKSKSKEAGEAVSSLKKQYQKVRDSIGKESYEEFIGSPEQQNNLKESLKEAFKFVVQRGPMAALGASLGSLAFGAPGKIIGGLTVGIGEHLIRLGTREYKMVRDVMANHPELWDLYGEVIKAGARKNVPRMVGLLNQASSRFESTPAKRGNRQGRLRRIPTK